MQHAFSKFNFTSREFHSIFSHFSFLSVFHFSFVCKWNGRKTFLLIAVLFLYIHTAVVVLLLLQSTLVSVCGSMRRKTANFLSQKYFSYNFSLACDTFLAFFERHSHEIIIIRQVIRKNKKVYQVRLIFSSFKESFNSIEENLAFLLWNFCYSNEMLNELWH
jgi:hypothetical protein